MTQDFFDSKDFFDYDSPERGQYNALMEDWWNRRHTLYEELNNQTTISLIANYYEARTETNEELYERACNDENLPYTYASLRDALKYRISRRDLPSPNAETRALVDAFYKRNGASEPEE
jgi:hypothetical protein